MALHSLKKINTISFLLEKHSSVFLKPYKIVLKTRLSGDII